MLFTLLSAYFGSYMSWHLECVKWNDTMISLFLPFSLLKSSSAACPFSRCPVPVRRNKMGLCIHHPSRKHKLCGYRWGMLFSSPALKSILQYTLEDMFRLLGWGAGRSAAALFMCWVKYSQLAFWKFDISTSHPHSSDNGAVWLLVCGHLS